MTQILEKHKTKQNTADCQIFTLIPVILLNLLVYLIIL